MLKTLERLSKHRGDSVFGGVFLSAEKGKKTVFEKWSESHFSHELFAFLGIGMSTVKHGMAAIRIRTPPDRNFILRT